MAHFLQRHLLSVFIVIILGIIGYLSWEKYCITETLEDFTVEEVIQITTNPKNKPFIYELFKLGNKVKNIRDVSYHDVLGEEKKNDLLVLTRICKDTCKAIRCRIDPGLGHACRINCPKSKIRPCRMSVKPVYRSELKNDVNQ